jgi:DNA-binding NtrC family response regulator
MSYSTAIKTINLSIIDQNKQLLSNLKHYLETKFGSSIKVSMFEDGETYLKSNNEQTQIVVLNPILRDKEGLEVLKSIKKINPKIEVIILSSDENISNAIELFRSGASDLVINGRGSWKRIGQLVTHLVTAPIRILVREFKISKYMAIFLLTFCTMGIVVFLVMQFII